MGNEMPPRSSGDVLKRGEGRNYFRGIQVAVRQKPSMFTRGEYTLQVQSGA